MKQNWKKEFACKNRIPTWMSSGAAAAADADGDGGREDGTDADTDPNTGATRADAGADDDGAAVVASEATAAAAAGAVAAVALLFQVAAEGLFAQVDRLDRQVDATVGRCVRRAEAVRRTADRFAAGVVSVPLVVLLIRRRLAAKHKLNVSVIDGE